MFGLGPISDTLTYVTESGVYPVNTGNNKLWDAPLTTVQPSVKSFCCTAALKENLMVILLQCEIFKYKTVLAVEADCHCVMCTMGLSFSKSGERIKLCSAVCVLFLPCEMIAFFLSDDPLLIERPPGKSINRQYISNSTGHVLLKLHWGFVLKRERDHSVKQLDRISFCLEFHSSTNSHQCYSLDCYGDITLNNLYSTIEPDWWISKNAWVNISSSQKQSTVFML